MIEVFLKKLSTTPETITFDEVIDIINSHYHFSPVRFVNGDVVNEKNTNNGSCRIFAFAKMHQLTQEQTLHCFGDYYRVDVVSHPTNRDHANIRSFMKLGWDGLVFDDQPLARK